LDAQSRLPVPGAFKDELSGSHFITQGFDRNLLILTAGAFQEVYRRVTSLNIADPLARLLLRMILGTAHEFEMDAGGRVVIPDDLRAFAGLDLNALLVGQGDYLEIWSPELWDAQAAQINDAEANGARFAMLTISTR
jgi:MraZ protein